MDNKNGLIEKIKGQGLQKLFSLIALVVLIPVSYTHLLKSILSDIVFVFKI